MERKKKKLKRSHRVFRAFYRTIIVLSALVVILYLASKIYIRPPEIPQATLDNKQTTSQEGAQEAGEDVPVVANQGEKTRRDKCFTFLLTASDDGNGNADTIMVMTYDVPNKKVGMISIPRDTVVKTTRRMPKINAAYAQGVETLKSEVEGLIGFPLDFYAMVDMKAFVQLVDAVGGVEFDVPIPMNYYDPVKADPTQTLSIYFHPGVQFLNGENALKVARFRKNSDGKGGYPDSDVGRTKTQQKLLSTLAKKAISVQNIPKIKTFVNIFAENVDTNMSVSNVLYFATEGAKLDVDRAIAGATLPGDGTKNYKGYQWCYVLYQEESLALINQHINPYTAPLTLSDVGFVTVP